MALCCYHPLLHPPSCAGGDLHSFVSSGPMEEPMAVRFTRQIAEGLQYLHERGIIHTNISVSVEATPPELDTFE